MRLTRLSFSSVSCALQRLTQGMPDSDSEEESNVPDKPPVHEIMQMWFDRQSDSDNQVVETDEPIDLASPAQELSDTFENNAQNYERLIAATPAYQWLVKSLCNRFLLTSASDDVVGQIRNEIYKHVPKPQHISKSASTMSTKAYFEMDWDFAAIGDIDDGESMDSILTVTGSEQDAQAMTCAEYIQQTWPTNGMYVWRLVKDALLDPGKTISSANADTMRMSARLGDYRLVITITGPRGVLVETAEQLCWMCGALNSAFSNLDDGILVCLPSLTWTSALSSEWAYDPVLGNSEERVSSHDTYRLPLHPANSRRTTDAYVSQVPSAKHQPSSTAKKAEAIPCFKITLDHKKCNPKLQSGTCWQSLFRRCVIVNGFPIRRRSKPELGLELSLELITKLMGTKYLYEFSEHVFFKQFSKMLAPSVLEDELLIWHLCESRDGSRMSYLDHGMLDLCEVGHDALWKVRHVIGWCSNIKHCAGHAAGDYNVEDACLEPSPPSGSLFGCQLSFGRPISSGKIIHFSANYQRVSTAQRNYIDMFRFLERRFVLLWDTGTSRGWMINGLRTLLHLLRQSFRIDAKEDLGGELFVLKPEDLVEPRYPHTAQAAREFFTNPKNLAAKVSISAFRGTDCEYETLGERLERLYDVIEQAFDYQSKCRKWDQIPRSHLEGWDFVSIARKDDTIQSSLLTLPSIGKNWVDFVRAAKIVTFMGCGFGEILQPGTPMCNSMPCDRYCLAVSVSDFQEIVSGNRCKLSTKHRLICRSPRIVWYSPPGSSDPCGCGIVEGRETKQQRLQIMWPAGEAAWLPAEDNAFLLEGYLNGAIIFGHDDSLHCYLPDFGEIPSFGPPPQASKELEMVDSGIGSSLDSNTGLEKVPTRSTLSPFDDPHSTLSRANSQSNLYGNSFMSGGYGVFGNVTGNLSVNQYFGPIPNQNAAENLLQAPQLAPQTIPSISQRSRDSSAPPPPSTQDQTVTLNPEQGRQDSTDIEMEQGQMEIKALGLQGFCNVFRY